MNLNRNVPFWLVWNPDRGLMIDEHPNESAAKDEAVRLAGLHLGLEFFVLQPIVSYSIGGVATTKFVPIPI